jgi:secreted PhoX family phosphatase
MVTKYDPTGAMVRGTLNNCGHGITPWGTFLGCEENWAVYFQIARGGKAADAKLTTSRTRYGVRSTVLAADAATSTGQGWYTVSATDDRFARWNISADGATAASDFRNEPNTFGYIVEIDPLDRTAMPAKRVGMGRFAHEGAWCSIPAEGRPLAFYMGCDSRNEYIYKFVSAANWSASDIGGGMAAGNKYLDEGKLYVARFNSDGTGDWLELTISSPAIQGYTAYSFANQADVFVNARLAADAVGATKMDRPEWGAVNPANGDVYFTLTNNNATNRTPTSTNAANPRSYADPDGIKRTGNPHGHIIRFAEDGGLATAAKFRWDIFLFGSEDDHPPTVNLSQLTAANALSSPDGLWFSPANGILWIETDDGAYTDETNCMLLAALPGKVGDGAAIVVDNELSGARAQQQTFIGALLGEARLRRFLVGPKGSEITGVTETPDGRALLVNIQHPGEDTLALGTAATFNFQSQWPGNGGGLVAPYGPTGRPRSATIVITRTDNGKIGL